MALWLAGAPLILASQSRVRRALLEAAGIPVEVLPAGLDERAIERAIGAEAPAQQVAVFLSRAKALAVAQRSPERVVVAADQVLAMNSLRLSKPTDRAAAREQLLYLRGKTHELISALAVCRGGAVRYEHAERARLTMRSFSDAFADAYLDEAGPAVTESVGGYQLEGMGIHLFEKIEGDFFAILGLPLLPLFSLLRKEGCLA
jgi:septum formation protein